VPVENVDFIDSSSCAFPVDVHYDQSRETLRIFSNGDFAVTGALKVTVSNADDPSKSMTINVSGPEFVFVSADGDVVARIVGAGFGPSFSLPIKLVFNHGQILFDVISGSVTEVGVSTDLCTGLS
jgi:hypothetical protein